MDIISMIMSRNQGGENWFTADLGSIIDKSMYELIMFAMQGTTQYKYSFDNKSFWNDLYGWANYNGYNSMDTGKTNRLRPNIAITDGIYYFAPCTFVGMGGYNNSVKNVYYVNLLVCAGSIYFSYGGKSYMIRCDMCISKTNSNFGDGKGTFVSNVTMTEIAATDSGTT